MTEWEIKGRQFSNCNCSYGCPCQFAAPPTHGKCEAVLAFAIDEGNHGDVRLDGLKAVGLYKWPGPVHEGGGKMQIVIDETADTKQREALEKILTGEDTVPMGTHWFVYSAMAPDKHQTLYQPVDFDVDVDARTARLSVEGVVESVGEPAKNPVTGDDVRARIDLPNGFEYRLAEIGSGSTKAPGAVRLFLKDTYGQFVDLHLSHAGVVE